VKGFELIYKHGYMYLKCGVIVMDLVPATHVQGNLFTKTARHGKTVMEAMDSVNKAFGKDTVRLAVQGFDRRYKLKAEHLSPCYTTNMKDILKIKI
jgi:DNA polymerase V